MANKLEYWLYGAVFLTGTSLGILLTGMLILLLGGCNA